MRGINHVTISGNVSDDVGYHSTNSGDACATFRIASSRRGARPKEVITAYIKVNVYIDPLVDLCRKKLQRGMYVIVEGELMNRGSTLGDLTEVRAKEIVFLGDERQDI